jgi:hypothetical protein
MAVAYFVEDENTLVYLMENGAYGILAGSVIRGGRNWLDGWFPAACAGKMRLATRADFDLYRVMPPKDFQGPQQQRG